MSESSPHRTRVEYRVIYGDTDQAGVVYHANYLRWFEAARCEYLRARGMSYTEMNAHGVHFPVVEVAVRYRRPARFEDVVWIDTWVTEVHGATLRFAYEVWRAGDPELLSEGSTTHACTNDAGRPVRIPGPVRGLVSR